MRGTCGESSTTARDETQTKHEEGAGVTVREFEFVLRFDISDVAASPYEAIELLGEQGCTDATIGVGIPGRMALAFSREAESATGAVTSAIRDVTTALPHAVLVEATPDLVGYSDVADIVGKSRQNIRKLLVTCKGASPLPVHEGSSTAWHLAPVLTWLRDEKDYSIGSDLIDLASVNMQVNITATQVNYGFVVDQGIKSLLSKGAGRRRTLATRGQAKQARA